MIFSRGCVHLLADSSVQCDVKSDMGNFHPSWDKSLYIAL